MRAIGNEPGAGRYRRCAARRVLRPESHLAAEPAARRGGGSNTGRRSCPACSGRPQRHREGTSRRRRLRSPGTSRRGGGRSDRLLLAATRSLAASNIGPLVPGNTVGEEWPRSGKPWIARVINCRWPAPLARRRRWRAAAAPPFEFQQCVGSYHPPRSGAPHGGRVNSAQFASPNPASHLVGADAVAASHVGHCQTRRRHGHGIGSDRRPVEALTGHSELPFCSGGRRWR